MPPDKKRDYEVGYRKPPHPVPEGSIRQSAWPAERRQECLQRNAKTSKPEDERRSLGTEARQLEFGSLLQ